MSLRLKFGVLLCLLGLAVTLTLGASWFAFSKLESEVSEPLRSMAAVLTTLGTTKVPIERCRRMFEAPRAQAPGEDDNSSARPVPPLNDAEKLKAVAVERRFFVAQVKDVQDSLNRQDLAADWRLRSGATSLKNLEFRLKESARLGEEYFAIIERSGDFDAATDAAKIARSNAQEAFTGLHDLVERIEDFIARSTQFAGVEISTKMRTLLLWVLAWAFLIVVLAVWLGIVLIHRWILEPVAALRTATAHIAAGDFAHRIILPQYSRPDELHQLSAEVNHMAGMVKSLQDDRVEQERLAALGEMVRRLAHNLRNPLAGIRGLAEISRSDLQHLGASGTDVREHQSKIIVAVDRFEKWLNELLSATRPLSVEPEPTRVDRWLKGLVDAHRPMAQTRGIALELDTSGGPTEAIIDSRHLEHALSAMLSNAIESTSSPQARGSKSTGGTVRLEVRKADPDHNNGNLGDFWSISITDQGVGVPPHLQESIFRPYFTTKRDGNGIGLAVALSVVKAHSGRIEVESPWPPQETGLQTASGTEPWPAGARFTIYLPVGGPELASHTEDVVASNGLSGAAGGQDPRHRR
jgi:signal transduction histidine kinase